MDIETPAFPTAPTDAPVRAGARASVQAQMEALGDLVGIGLKLARAIERQVDEAGEAPRPDLNATAIAFARVTRAVRQTIMLQTRLQEVQGAMGAAPGGAGDRKGGVTRILRRAIEEEFGGATEIERLSAEAAERLEQEFLQDRLNRPVGAIVAGICEALGLDPDWPGLASDIAAVDALTEFGAAARDADDDEPGDICWIGADGRWTPASELLAGRLGTGPSSSGTDPALEADTS